jgi:DNA-3-methyladenine glycosylase I
MTQTNQSKAMSNALKKMGWKFVGPTTCYALMQASGIVNDHLDGCFARPRIADLRTKMSRPS